MKRDEWAKHVAAWKRSRQTANEYGTAHRITAKKLHWWSWHLRAGGRRSGTVAASTRSVVAPPPTALLPVKVLSPAGRSLLAAPESASPTYVQIVLPNGSLIHAAPPVDPRWLGRLIAEAGAPPR